MKYKYLVFEQEDYYPAGGMEDCVLKTNEVNLVKREMRKKDVSHVYDCVTGEVYYTIADLENAQ